MEIHKSANRDPLPKMGREQYEMTATQVAEVMGISRQRVEHIERRALLKIRRMLKERFAGGDFFDDLGEA